MGGWWQTEVTTGQRVKPRSESRNAPPTLTTTPGCGRGSEHFSLLLSSSVDGHDGDGDGCDTRPPDKSQREESSRGRAVVTAGRRKAPAASSHLPNSLRRSRFRADLGKQGIFCLSACLPRGKTLLLPRFLSSQSLTSHTAARRPPNEKTTTSKDGARPLPFHSHAETASRRSASGGR